MNLRPFPRWTWYGDALPDGRFVVLHRGSHLETERGRVELPSGQNLLYVYLHTDGRFCGVGHQPPVQDRALVYEPLTGRYSDHGEAVGPNGVIFDAAGNLHVNAAGSGHATGWRYVADDGSLVWNDDTYADPTRQVWEYTTHGDVVIGQGGEGPYGDDPCIVLYQGKRYLLSEGRCRAIRFHRSGDQLAIAFSREDIEAAVCVWLTVAEIPTLREITVTPPIPKPEPPPPPKPEPVPMPEIPNSLSVVKAARAKYAHLSGRERAYRICNQVAWDLRALGAGLFYKSSGDNYASRSSDVLIFKPDGQTFDILGDAEGDAKPQWGRTQPTGFGDLKNWRAPVDPASLEPTPTPQPTPEPEPEPEPPPTPEPPPATCSCQAELAALTSALELLSTRVRLLETSPLPKLKVSGGTSKTWGHAHEITLMVEKA